MLPAHLGTDNHPVHISDCHGTGSPDARLVRPAARFNAEFRYAIMFKDFR